MKGPIQLEQSKQRQQKSLKHPSKTTKHRQPDQILHRRDQLLNLEQELLLSMDLDLHRDRLYWCFLKK